MAEEHEMNRPTKGTVTMSTNANEAQDLHLIAMCKPRIGVELAKMVLQDQSIPECDHAPDDPRRNCVRCQAALISEKSAANVNPWLNLHTSIWRGNKDALGTCIEYSQSEDFGGLSAKQVARMLAHIIGNCWEQAHEIDEKRKSPSDPSVVTLIEGVWRAEADYNCDGCPRCGYNWFQKHSACEQCNFTG